jgi:hypothetical protein
MHRSKRALAKIRQGQPEPLTPMSMSAPPTPALTPAELAAAKEERIETAVRTNAVIFGLRSELSFEERERTKERHEHAEQYRRLQSRIERLEQDLSAQWANFNQYWIESAQFHKAKLLALVRDGKLCTNAAAPPDEIQKEAAARIEKGETQCQSQ